MTSEDQAKAHIGGRQVTYSLAQEVVILTALLDQVKQAKMRECADVVHDAVDDLNMAGFHLSQIVDVWINATGDGE